jgi:hypothetical protein
MLDVDNNRGRVTDSNFARLIKTVGPFIEGIEIVHQVRALIATPWFIGTKSAVEAHQLLISLPRNPFLVRFSSKTGDFTITYKLQNKIYHMRIPPNAKYNLHQFVKLFCKKNKLSESPQSPFKYIFQQKDMNAYFKYNFIQ